MYGVNVQWCGIPLVLLTFISERFDLFEYVLSDDLLDVNVVDDTGFTIINYFKLSGEIIPVKILLRIQELGFNMYDWKNVYGEDSMII